MSRVDITFCIDLSINQSPCCSQPIFLSFSSLTELAPWPLIHCTTSRR